MLLRVVCLTLLILATVASSQELHEEKRRIGLRLPNFLRYKDPESSLIQKRRIGLRLPNMLKFKDSGSSMYHLEKRRMGMRLPNIIFLRNEKKNVFEY